MYKVLLKKQFEELFSRVILRSMGGIRYVKLRMLLFSALAVYILGVMVFLFYQVGGAICAPLCAAGLSWMYFALMGLIVTLIGLVFSVFIAHSMLYRARDNELLLSMPVTPGAILFSRMAVIYLIGFFMEIIAWVPVCVQYFREQSFSAGVLAANAALVLAMPLLSLVLSSVLGWLIALLSSRIRNSVAVTVILTLGFAAGYYYLYVKASEYVRMLILHSGEASAKIRAIFYPFYQLGRGAIGDRKGLLLFIGMALAAFAVVYAVLSASFIRLVTARRGAVRTVYREKAAREGSADGALLAKEFRRLTASSVYMLNSGLGAAALLAGAGAAIIKGKSLNMFLRLMMPAVGECIPLILCAAVAAISSLNALTASSISLEGKNFWLVKSLPVMPWQVLRAKLRLHLLVSGIPAVLCATVLAIVTRQEALFCILIPICCLLFVLVCAAFGLWMNLELPNFSWVNEAVVVKQSMSVTLSLLAPWVVLAAFGFLYYACRGAVSVLGYLTAVTVLLGMLAAILLHILRIKGTKIFEEL